ncbi:hypothetical protein GCM10028806_52730 [Spirosoma terrae]|uniref:Right handed beta helix domain-containing protein n=1 Tax=Spirosoma terrae TaxID=1968276 RepID=A0A6L9LJ29_9BACT|nr:right-handed parallel beta-helix repeat-containing protein [Spirosoma terrae]NDU96629.1 hypothetical protein [Spirosoma terrae]
MPNHYVLFFVLCWTTSSFAQSYYVCQSCGNANDSNPGTLASPWKTIGRSCQAGAVLPGSTVYIRSGTYYEKLTVNVAGAQNQPITFRPYNTDLVRVDGGSAAGVLLAIRNKSYLIIDGLTFQNAIGSNSDGIQISGNAQSITIKNCTINTIAFDATLNTPTNASLHNAHGILVKGDDPVNPISNFLMQGNTINQIKPGYSEGITFVGNIDNFQVLDNIVSNIANIGMVFAGYYSWACPSCPQTATTQNQARRGTISRNQVISCRGPLAFAAGIYADGSKDLVIEGNVVRDCQRGIQINCENPSSIAGASASNISIRNNLIYKNSRAGLGLGSHSYSTNLGKVTSCSVVNNSLFDNFIDRPEATATTNEDFGEMTLSYSENCVVENNIFHAGNRQRLLNSYDTPASVNLRFNYNLWFTNNANPFWVLFSSVYYGLNAFRTGTGQEANGAFGNPAFVSTSPGINLALTSTSAAINLGNPAATSALAGSLDYSQQARFRAGRIDAGAYEYPKPVLSIASGSWHTTNSWDCGCIPTRFDLVQIQSGHTISINSGNGTAQAQQLTLRGRLQYVNAGRLQLAIP